MPLDLRSLSRPPAVFPANVRAVHILEEFHSRGEEFAVIVDEYGGVAGIVTLGDLATTVLGGEEPAIVGAAGSWIVDGMIKFDDFLRRFPLANVEADEYETLAGFVIARMGDLPHLGDRMTYGGYTFEIVDMDGKRIHRVAIGYERDIEPA